MDRDADRPRLVGDGAGDRLADPPRRVGAELEPAAVLVLVDRPHQAGVAFLNQVEEAQAAVAVLLGDAHDQPQVAAGQFALGLLVLAEAELHDRDALTQARRLFERDQHQVEQFLFEARLLLLLGPDPLQRRGARVQAVHAVGDLLQLLHQRLDFLRADRQLLDQRHRLAAAGLEPLANFLALGLVGAGVGPVVDEPVEVVNVVLHQRLQRPQVVRHPLEDFVLLQILRLRHLDGAVERQVPGVDALQGLEDVPQGVVALQHLAAEAAAGDFDLLGQRDFLLAGQERDFAHLGEVHADRVVDVPAVAVRVLEARLGLGGDDFLGDVGRVGGRLGGVGLVDQVDAVGFEQFENLGELFPVGGALGERPVDLVVGQGAGQLPLLDENLQHVVGLLVHDRSSRSGRRASCRPGVRTRRSTELAPTRVHSVQPLLS